MYFRSVVARAALFSVTRSCLLTENMLDEFYFQEAYESLQRFKSSKTYPGSIKAATPGDTRFYDAPRIESILHENERHFWRVVVDDPLVESSLVTIRVRFRENAVIMPRIEPRLHILSVIVPSDCTVRHLHEAILIENRHPWLALNAFSLAKDSKALDASKCISDYGIGHNGVVDAIDIATDHLYHVPEGRPKDWNASELTATELQKSPYKEVEEALSVSGEPRMLTKPTPLEKYGPIVR